MTEIGQLRAMQSEAPPLTRRASVRCARQSLPQHAHPNHPSSRGAPAGEAEERAIFESMNAVKARVHNGRLVLDEPTELPEGTEVVLVAIEQGDELGDEERVELDRAIHEGLDDLKAGRMVDGDEVIARLRARG